MNKLCVGALLLLATALMGCGPGGSGELPVEGNVTFQDKAVDNGEIVFTPADGQTASIAAKITAGKYACQLPPGKSQVRITAYREVPGQFDNSNPGQPSPLIEMYIPDEYNAKSTLEVTVDSAKKDLDFEL